MIKENCTNRIRPIFDGSARQKISSSINDCLEKGPNIVELILIILNKFRLKKIDVIEDFGEGMSEINHF